MCRVKEVSILKKISYKKLWKLLIDKEMNKTELAAFAGVSGSTITRLSKGESVTLEVIVKLCDALECDIQDIVELIPKD
ncbi:MAG: helix-turn-helix transcriptional regulator [Defluviitaleaceae bacterium]|nr:helix-turn-helix transcriptional regulator [Defluviitaleaceae bacterium]